MSEQPIRYGYRDSRVLIEASRVLQPPLSGATITITGAQVEMLRNITQYLNRIDTYVKKYEIGYYWVPTVEQWDSIQAIVADLEEKLMGDENTIWGYKERIAIANSTTVVTPGSYRLTLFVVPAGFVYVVTTIISNNAGSPCKHTHQLYDAEIGNSVHIVTTSAGNELVIHTGQNYVLQEGDSVRVFFEGVAADDFIVGRVWGHKMAVPT